MEHCIDVAVVTAATAAIGKYCSLQTEIKIRWQRKTPSDLFPLTTVCQLTPIRVEGASEAVQVLFLLSRSMWCAQEHP